MFKKIFIAGLSLIFAGFLFNSQVAADEITISVSGNGGGSENSAAVTANTTTTVTQTNNADINNSVSGNSNTGNNQASNNSGDANINTGSAGSTNTVNNQNINSNNIDNNCNCVPTNVTADISGNGANSTNSLGLNLNNNTNASQSNSAQITNNVNSYANSGHNTANNNNGDASIRTGNATALTSISNKDINLNVDPQGGNSSNFSITINGNGVGSVNLASLFFNKSFDYTSNNVIALFNNVTNVANTGDNTADNNNGAVLIATGNAVSVVGIANENINGSLVNLLCDCKITPPPSGDGEHPNAPPATPPSSGGNGGSTSVQNAGGQVLGAAIGTVLPATGGYFLLLMTILCLTIFLAGWYLRFGSGISPPFAYAV